MTQQPAKPTGEDFKKVAVIFDSCEHFAGPLLISQFAQALAEERAKLEAKVQAYRDIAILERNERLGFPGDLSSVWKWVDAEAERILKEREGV